jgi:Tn3 transposase DDE domain
VLTTLGLPESPDALLAEHARTLDAAYREVGGRLAVNTEVRVDDAGKIHLTGVKAVEEPPSLDVDETYRRDIKGVRNLQEGRHALARKICHGKKGELYHRYERGLENQLGVLGLVLNCVVLWTTVYLDAAVRQLRAQGYPVREEDMARLSPFVSRHLGVHGAYSFLFPDLAPGAIRDLRDPDATDDDDE